MSARVAGVSRVARLGRKLVLQAAHAGAVAAALLASLAAGGPGDSLGERLSPFGWCVAVLVAVRLPALAAFGLGRLAPRLSPRREVVAVLLAAGLGSAALEAAVALDAGETYARPGRGVVATELGLSAGLLVATRRALRGLARRLGGQRPAYERWIREVEGRRGGRDGAEARLARLGARPLVTVITPVYRPRPGFLERAIRSVRDQSYPDWELVLVDDGSGSPEIEAVLRRASREDARVRWDAFPENRGISAASNRALALARGDFVALLDHDDELAPGALLHVAEAIAANPEADLLYSDEDHMDADGRRGSPFFKPDWSPDLVLGENYVCHLMVFRRALAEKVGGFRSETDGSQDHDLLLRLSGEARSIVHVPHILYHWRTEVTPTVSDRVSFQTDRTLASSRRAVEDHLRRTGVPAWVEEGRWAGRWRIRYPVPDGLEVVVLVRGVVPPELLHACLASIAGRTDYPHYRVVVAAPEGSLLEGGLRDAGEGRGRPRIDLLPWAGRPGELAGMGNALARRAAAESPDAMLLFLDGDTEVRSRDWLGSLVELAARPEVGVVGAKLLDPDGRILHAGLVLGVLDGTGRAFRGCRDGDRVYFDFPDLVRNVSAVSGACLMIRSRLFLALGGFDEAGLPVAHSDVDLCLRAQAQGLRVLFDPHAVLLSRETLSRTRPYPGARPAAAAVLRERWPAPLARDPFYSPNLSTRSEAYDLRRADEPGPPRA